MDMRTGRIYPDVDTAMAAGVPFKHLTRIRGTAEVRADPYRCERCDTRIRPRRSTPSKAGSDGLTRYWCKACWKKLGNY